MYLEAKTSLQIIQQLVHICIQKNEILNVTNDSIKDTF